MDWGDSVLPDRFWAKAQRDGEHWLWKKATTGGYGVTGIGYEKVGYVHRLIYSIVYGEPCGMVLHHCDIRTCFYPPHLYEGTHQKNMDDMVGRGRSNIGTRNPQAVLSEQQVLQLRARAGYVPQTQLAEEFGICQSTVSRIVRRRLWPHL